ncbi:MAG TPA: O-antigen ligase family protein [Puia sp.]|jgi:putative inorganic carbon (HCO3(-)) transporter|nr:O-antigen ligase family protein [Puia sp.]
MPKEFVTISNYFFAWTKKELVQKKLLSPLGIIFWILLAAGSGILSAFNLILVPFSIAGILIGIVIVYLCLFKPLTGFYIVNFLSFFIFFPNHVIGRDVLPSGIIIELLTLFVFMGSVLSIKSKDVYFAGLLKTGVSITFLILTLYVAIQAFNPNVDGFDSWLATFKRSIFFILLYISCYCLIDTKEKLRYFIRFWVYLSFVAAAYGCYQQWFGYFSFEMNYIMRAPGGYEILFQGGQLRKFSFLSDVVGFGVLAGCMALLTLLLAINEKDKIRKYRFYFFSIIMSLGMAYSGTRTTNIIIPAGLVLYFLITIQNRTTLYALFIAAIIAIVILFLPIHNNATLNRVRSTFDSQDASFNLRNKNRHQIQPYIYSHPLGGGMGTTNFPGLLNHPNHPLAGFATDSGYLKAALEIGWIGLALMILFNLAILFQGINYYFKMKDKELKFLLLIILCTLFPNIITQYSQETTGQYPFCIFFFSSLSLMQRLKEFDENENVLPKQLVW